MSYIKIQLVVEDTEILTSYDPPATNHFVKKFEAGVDSPISAWYAVYYYQGHTGQWMVDCASLHLARMAAKAFGEYYHCNVQEDFPQGYKIAAVERPLS